MRKVVVGVCLLLSLNAMAQQTYSFQSAGETMLLMELRAVLEEKEGGIAVAMALPAKSRLEVYRNLDIQKGDQIPFINKKRVRNLAAFTEVYENLAVGDTVMLGVKRGEGDMFILRFPKIDEKQDGMQVQRVSTGGDINMSDMKVMPEAGIIVKEADRRVKIMAIMPTAKEILGFQPQKDDVLVAINGNEVGSLAMVGQFYDAIEQGAEVTLEFLRGEETLKATFKKTPRRGGSVVVQ